MFTSFYPSVEFGRDRQREMLARAESDVEGGYYSVAYSALVRNCQLDGFGVPSTPEGEI
jgi:hypothetical protein